jgi:hypothetical protein
MHCLLCLDQRERNMSEIEPQDPHDPPPQEDPTHNVPVYPEQDPPPAQETPIKAAAGKPREGDEGGPPHPGVPSKGKDAGHDVEEDDLDPKAPHSPPDASKKGRVLFDENTVTG